MSEPHERLDRAMEDRRLELRSSWAQVARDADISPQALRAIRRGEYRPSRLTTRGLDAALQWAPGSVEAVLDGEQPTPVSTVELTDSATASDHVEVERRDAPAHDNPWRELREMLDDDPELARMMVQIIRRARRAPETPGEEDRRRDAG